MRNIYQIATFIQYLLRKQMGVFQSFDQICSNLDTAQLNLLEDYFKEYGANQIIHDSLRPFRVLYQFSSPGGFVTYPSDYIHLIGSPFTVTGSTVNEITFVNEDEWVSALNSQLRPVSTARPLAKDTANGFYINPPTSQLGYFSYIRRPAIPQVIYNQVGRAITYDAPSSTQLEWTDVYINAIISKSLAFSGINMSEPEIVQFSQQFNQESE